MDRSLDSIGSCSLDVDADSSDISDTSGSLNFPTPLSVKDITREFTANIRERCVLRSPQQLQHTTTAYVDPATGQVRMVLTPSTNAEHSVAQTDTAADTSTVVAIDDGTYEKKPSYLNLACCVNGYSNLTTYDSKIRQDINKSREVSPIRPSTSSLQYCKKNNSLAAPILLKMPNVSVPLTKQPSPGSKYDLIETNNNRNGHHQNGYNGSSNGDAHKHGTTSFIQQRVERLYGPGALAQGFYSPKAHSPLSARSIKQQLGVESPQSSELARKFKQLSPSKDYSEFRKKLNNNCNTAAIERQTELTTEVNASGNIGEVDLPVFRHLSHEFRAQLPTVSPKRNVPRTSPAPEVVLPMTNGSVTTVDVVDHEPVLSETPLQLKDLIGTTKMPVVESAAVEKDGNYFLKILKAEQARLLALAAVADKYTDALTNNPDISEDTFGFLRSASGKARLLASQKMKQFEGLCYKNLNRSPEDAFPTTADDLQGFWDMVYLQVEHVDAIFEDVEKLKSNDWKRITEPEKAESMPTKTTKTTKTGNLKANANSNGNSTKSNAASSAAALKREAQRKQLMEMKRLRREAMTAAAKNQTACDGVNELQDAIGDSVKIAVAPSS